MASMIGPLEAESFGDEVAIVHDYLTQRGGAERVVLSMCRAFPDAPLATTLYRPEGTFEEFGSMDVRASPLNAVRLLRHHHRAALPLLPWAISRLQVDACVTLCSSSGWAHGVPVTGRKIVYCHNPARWLYQPSDYLVRNRARRGLFAAVRQPLERWDRRAAATADRYIANSKVVRDRIRRAYGVDAEVLPPPPALAPDGPTDEVDVPKQFLLAVARLLPYKNVAAVAEACRSVHIPLVIVGSGPDAMHVRAAGGENVTVLSNASDAELRFLYSRCSGVVSAAYEDFGLVPLEAANFGRPVAALRWGGFLETVEEWTTGVYFDQPTPPAIECAIRDLLGGTWSDTAIRAHGAAFSEKRFIDRLQTIVNEEMSRA